MCTYSKKGREANILFTMYPNLAGQELVYLGTYVSGFRPGWNAPPGHLFAWLHDPESGRDTLLTVPSVVFNSFEHNPQNKLDPEVVARFIVGESYTVLPSGKSMICELRMANGYTCVGTASVIDPTNFDFDKARAASRRRAMDDLYKVLGYAKQDIVHGH